MCVCVCVCVGVCVGLLVCDTFVDVNFEFHIHSFYQGSTHICHSDTTFTCGICSLTPCK